LSERRYSDQYLLRMPDGMRDRIKAQAERNGRSMNSEIVMILEAALQAISTISTISTMTKDEYWALRVSMQTDTFSGRA
jgi:plasmid stability protein